MDPNTTCPLKPFDRALKAYLAGLPQDKKKFKFVDLCRGSGVVAPQEIHDLIDSEVSNRTLSGPAKRLFNRIVTAVKDLSGVIDQIARCKDMFDLMKDELRSLADLIENMTDYEDLYGNSETMQNLFFRSYTNIISFWHRVHKECKRTEFGSFRRSLTSARLNKLKSIVGNLKVDVNSISQKAFIEQAKLDAKEHSSAEKERTMAGEERAMAGEERTKAGEERSKQSDWRQKQSDVNYIELSTQIRKFLTPRADFANSNYHEKNLQHYKTDTCQWLTEDPNFIDWSNSTPSPENAIFCVSGPAGFGKSILSSYTIQHLQEKRNAAVAFFFCQFSEPCENARDILLLFALQLFNIYFARKLPVDEALCHRVLCCTSMPQIQDLIKELSDNLCSDGPVCFVVDGLDEAQKGSSQQTISSVLKFVCEKMLESSKLWITMRKQARPVDCYEMVVKHFPHFAFEMTNQTEADVVRYLEAKFAILEQRFGELSDDDRIIFHFSKNYLKARAKGHFLWARLMTEDLEGIEDAQDLLKRLHGFPERLDDLYRDIFCRIRSDNRKIASKIIGLVAFSRRQLRVEEVREAAILLVTRGKKGADDGGLVKMPANTILSKFTALVEIDKGLPDSEGSCRLVHSSVLEFLINHPKVLGDEPALQITPRAIADACLNYLARPVYGNLLKMRSLESEVIEWLDSSGNSMDGHHFVQYAAKYWPRHLEDIDPDKAIRGRVTRFVESKNFQTCMQIQTIWIQGKFDVYSVGGRKSILRNLPEWLISSPSVNGGRPEVSKHWSDYRVLLHDWRRLLSCGGCHDSEPECPVLAFRGDIDRIWWPSLGSNNIFSGFTGRYVSFSLVENADNAPSKRENRFEALCVTLDRLIALRFIAWNHQAGTLEFICEHWASTSPGCAPTVQRKQTIRTDDVASNWRLYSKHDSAVTGGSRELLGKPVMFSATGECLRIGAQVFILNSENDYDPLTSNEVDKDVPEYFEEVVNRGAYVAIGSRAYSTAKEIRDHPRFENRFGKDFQNFEQASTHGKRTEYSDDEYSDDDDDDDDRTSSDESSGAGEAEGYETWSEGSTEVDDEILLDSDTEESLSGSDTESSAENDTDSSANSQDFQDDSDDSDDSDSDSDENEPPNVDVGFEDRPNVTHDDESDDESASDSAPPDFVNRDLDSDDEDELWGHVVDSHLGIFSSRRPPLRHRSGWPKARARSKMLLVVLDNSGNHPKKLFQFEHPLSLMLYESPPAIHPHEPLVVWPLGAGDIVFADFELKTYFTRKVKASAPYSRNISTKLHFHPSGRFLHVAFVEAQLGYQGRPSTHKHKNQTPRLPALKLSALLSTYRLSSTKTTRSPPSLIHRVKVDLGEHLTLTPTRIPFTFTWANDDLFISRHTEDLILFRISLFARQTREQNILTPRNRVILPDTTPSRDVHFIPSFNGTPARIILSSELSGPRIPSIDVNADPLAQLFRLALAMENDGPLSREMLSPPVGCLLQEEDIGEWVKMDEVPVPKRQGAGKLDQRKERFDPVDDCDVAPYLRFV
ncbi:hypothetical protein SCHPADRAFT_942985 [Schizopora paradoxa]|uniref:Nephrocystin 3-like N-terminal domain-containing protein n=1 Tax=Schizopora paradoxa TaxID=27342 RepID=A0A0H2REH1_9AGAM|nr:hypothetical protein SCHPADRAFT_942985 [Schizopora paradoxa]